MASSRSDNLLIASRYAAAMFDLAEQAGTAEDISDEMNTLAAAIKDSSELETLLRNPLVLREAKSNVLLALAKKGNKLTRESLATIAEQGRAELIPGIAAALTRKVAEARGELVAEVTSARALSPVMEKKIADSIAKATGKKVVLELKENPAVLGGVSIRIGSLLLDATLKAALDSMKTGLLAATA